MISIAKGMTLPDMNKSGILLTGIVLIAVVALFFLPELLNYHPNISGTNLSPVTKSSESHSVSIPQAEQAATVSQAGPLTRVSPLEQIRDAIDQGYIEKLRDARRRLAIAGTLDDGRGAKAGDAAPELSVDQGKTVLPPLPSLSWRQIRSPKSLEALRAAQMQAVALSKGLEDENTASRYALINFIQGVNLVLQGGEKSMKPEDVPAYLENLDLAVTTAFTNDRVDNANFTKWSEITVGPLLQNPEGVTLKRSLVPPFVPQVGLSSVDIAQNGFRGKRDPAGASWVAASGFVKGKDVTKISLFRNYDLLRDLQISKQTNLGGARTFKIPRVDAQGVYTLRIFNKSGSYVDRSYTFLNKVSRFAWSPRTRKFAIPFAEYDPMLDRYFAVKRNGARQDPNFINSGDWVSF